MVALGAGWIPGTDVAWLEAIRVEHEQVVAAHRGLVGEVTQAVVGLMSAGHQRLAIEDAFSALPEDEQALAAGRLTAFVSPLSAALMRGGFDERLRVALDDLWERASAIGEALGARAAELEELAASNRAVAKLVASLRDEERAATIAGELVADGVRQARRVAVSEHQAMGNLGDTRGRDARLAELDAIAARYSASEDLAEPSASAEEAEEVVERIVREREEALRRDHGQAFEDGRELREVVRTRAEGDEQAALYEAQRAEREAARW